MDTIILGYNIGLETASSLLLPIWNVHLTALCFSRFHGISRSVLVEWRHDRRKASNELWLDASPDRPWADEPTNVRTLYHPEF